MVPKRKAWSVDTGTKMLHATNKPRNATGSTDNQNTALHPLHRQRGNRRRSEARSRGPLSEGARAAGHPRPDQDRSPTPPLLFQKFKAGHRGWAQRCPRHESYLNCPQKEAPPPAAPAQGTRRAAFPEVTAGCQSRCSGCGARSPGLVAQTRTLGTEGGSRKEQAGASVRKQVGRSGPALGSSEPPVRGDVQAREPQFPSNPATASAHPLTRESPSSPLRSGPTQLILQQ